MRAWLVGIAAVLTVVAWAPAIAVVATYGIASLAGCEVDEASVHPCRVGPVDIGGLLYGLGVSGWFFLGTWPLAVASILFWPGFAIYALVRRGRRRPG